MNHPPSTTPSAVTRRGLIRAAGLAAAATTVHVSTSSALAATEPQSSQQGGNHPPHSPISWHGSMGTHKRVDPDRWLGLTRGLGPEEPIDEETGISGDVTDLPHDGIEPVIGRFSGEERFYNYPGQLAILRRALGAGIQYMRTAGALPRPDRPEVREYVLANDGKYFKDRLYDVMTTLNTGEFDGAAGVPYWEFGNEINNSHRFSVFDYEGPDANNPKHLADYVDFYAAPAVEAIAAASRDIYGDPDRIKMIAPCIALGPSKSGPHAGTWNGALESLDFILNYRITDRSNVSRRSKLRGRRFWEVIDLFSIHYTLGNHEVMAELYDKWIASHKMRGYFHTEELGRRGRGAYQVTKFAFRYLDFWTQRPWSKDTSRACYWGDNIDRVKQGINVETRGIEAEELLGTFLQDYPLVNAREEIDIRVGASYEAHAVRADVGDAERRYAVYVTAVPEAQAELRTLRLMSEDGFDQLASLSVTRVDAVTLPEEYTPADVTTDEDGVLITFDREIALNDSFVILARFTK